MIRWRFHVKPVKHNGKFYLQVKVSDLQTGMKEISEEEYNLLVSVSMKTDKSSNSTVKPTKVKRSPSGKQGKKSSKKKSKKSPSTKAK